MLVVPNLHSFGHAKLNNSSCSDYMKKSCGQGGIVHCLISKFC